MKNLGSIFKKYGPYSFKITLPACTLFIVAANLLLVSPAMAQVDYKGLLKAYYDRAVYLYDGSWSYVARVDDALGNEVTVRSFDPKRVPVQRRQLITINGEAPSEQAIKKFRKEAKQALKREHNRERKSEQDTKTLFWSMIVQDSIKFEKEIGNEVYLSFDVDGEKLKNFNDRLSGLFVLDLKNQMIKEMRIESTEKFSPQFMVFVDSLYLSLRYSLQNGYAMQTSMIWKLAGSAYIFKDLGADMKISWDNFVRLE